MANLFSEKPIVKVVMLKGQDGEEKLINQADGSGLSFWVGTRAEYEAIPAASLVNNCIYYITDDTRDDFNTRLDALDNKIDNHIAALNQTLWAGAVSDESTTEEQYLTATGIENYSLVGLVVGGPTSPKATILAYRSTITVDGEEKVRFAGQIQPLAIDTEYMASIYISAPSQARFSYATKHTGTAVQGLFLYEIIGIM